MKLNDTNRPDATRIAAAVLFEELSAVAGRLAAQLRSAAELPPIVVGKLLVDADKTLTKLARHADCLTQGRHS